MSKTINAYLGLSLLVFSLLAWGTDSGEVEPKTLHESKLELTQAIQTLKDIAQTVDFKDDASFEHYARSRKKLNALILERKKILSRLPDRDRNPLLGFGPEGVRNMQLELKWIHSLWPQLQIQRGWHQFITDVELSPTAVLSAILQLLLALVLFRFWRSRCLPHIQSLTNIEPIENTKSASPFIQSVSWRYLRIHNPLEYWLLLNFAISVAAELWRFIDFTSIQTIINWLLWGQIIIRLIDSFSAARYRRSHQKDAQAKLRLKSFKLFGYVFIVTGLLLALIDVLGLGGGTLASWIQSTFFWAVVPVFIIVVRWWRPIVMQQISLPEHQERVIPNWVKARQSGPISLVAVLIGAGYLILMRLSQRILQIAGERELVRSAMAYLFRVEIARQSAKEQEQTQLTPVVPEQCPEFNLVNTYDYWIEGVARNELKRIADACESEKSTINILYADRGRGKSTFLKRLGNNIKNNLKVETLQIPAGGDFASILELLGDAIGLGNDSGARDVAAAFKESDRMVIILDDVHRIIKPSIGGLKELERLVRFIRRSSQNISWVFTIESSSWQFVARARGERFLFDLELELPRWQEEQIAELIDTRTKQSGVNASYEGMVVPRQLDVLDESKTEQLSRGYARIIWEYSKGNPGVALYLWEQSLFQNEQKQFLIRLFEIPDTSELDGLSVTLLLVLRAILQLEQAIKMDIAKATNLNSDEVTDTLRLLTSKGYIERCNNNFYTISWPWYRAVTTVLNRQHLVIL